MSGKFGIFSKQLWWQTKHFRNVPPCILLTFQTYSVSNWSKFLFPPAQKYKNLKFNANFFLELNRFLCNLWVWRWLEWPKSSRFLPWQLFVLINHLWTGQCCWTHWTELPSDSLLQTASFLMTIKASAQMTHYVFLPLLSSPSHMATRWIGYK